MLRYCLNPTNGIHGIVIWGGVAIFVIITAFHWFKKKETLLPTAHVESEKDAMTLLNERFILGEITEEEFIHKKKLLQK